MTEDVFSLVDEPPTLDTFWAEGEHWALRDADTSQTADALIRQAEAKFGIRLPALLKALYERKKGGYTHYSYYPRVPNPRPAREDWVWVNIGEEILPPHRLETLGELSDMTDFPDKDSSYRSLFPDADRLIVMSRHGWESFLCLDYRTHGPEGDPEVVYLEEELDGLKEVLRAPSFETFFEGLRKIAE